MPRLAVVDPASAQGRAKELFDGPLKGKHLNIFKGMANSGAALDAYVAMSGALAKGLLNAKEREVVQLAIGEANRCDYCVAAHTAIAKSAGLTEDQTLGARRILIDDPKLNALAKFARAVHEMRGRITDGDIQAFKSAGYTDGHAAEVIANIALATYTNFFNLANQTDIDFPAAPAL